mmetsp:Transcript_4935/g.9421  ORF Transcript_4935/g.9421 Transcript_4935/m.9421 type:complete len:210 (+) Transcript_4935:18-647(+)
MLLVRRLPSSSRPLLRGLSRSPTSMPCALSSASFSQRSVISNFIPLHFSSAASRAFSSFSRLLSRMMTRFCAWLSTAAFSLRAAWRSEDFCSAAATFWADSWDISPWTLLTLLYSQARVAYSFSFVASESDFSLRRSSESESLARSLSISAACSLFSASSRDLASASCESLALASPALRSLASSTSLWALATSISFSESLALAASRAVL